MSTSPDNEFDLEKLFLPAWAQEPSNAKLYAKYEGTEETFDRRSERRGPRGLRGPRREGRPGGGREEGRRREPRERHGPPRPVGERPIGPRGGGRPTQRREQRREAPPPLPEISVSLVPDEKGVESLARQVKMTGRAYPLFEIAQMILQKPERHTVVFNVKKNPEGKPIQPLFLCALDDTVWLSEDEAVAHVLKKHFNTFYQAERTPTEPPKGKYTFVAQCGMSGIILGPPNYHDYQNQLRKLHSERFPRLPFEVYKSRVKIVRDEEVVKKWVEDQSWKTEYVCLNLPEALRLGNMEAVEKHFREIHKDNIIKPVESHTLSGVAARNLRSPDLVRLVRSAWEDQRRFPLQMATVLSQQFAGHGLQFFKVNKTITHVSVARPHYLDLEATPVSDGIKRIVEFVNLHPRCSRRELVEKLAPSPAPTAAPETNAAQTATAFHEPTAEQTAVISDLHWLVHQGHVIEFANGTLETAKKPAPKPPKPEPKAPPPATGPATEAAPAGETSLGAEAAPAPEAPPAEEGPANATEVAAPTAAEPVATQPEVEAVQQEPSSAPTPPPSESPASVESPS